MKLTESELFLDEREASGIEAREQTISSNADFIRSMNDEELAVHFAELIFGQNNGAHYSDDVERWLEWLESPCYGGFDNAAD